MGFTYVSVIFGVGTRYDRRAAQKMCRHTIFKLQVFVRPVFIWKFGSGISSRNRPCIVATILSFMDFFEAENVWLS